MKCLQILSYGLRTSVCPIYLLFLLVHMHTLIFCITIFYVFFSIRNQRQLHIKPVDLQFSEPESFESAFIDIVPSGLYRK